MAGESRFSSMRKMFTEKISKSLGGKKNKDRRVFNVNTGEESIENFHLVIEKINELTKDKGIFTF